MPQLKIWDDNASEWKYVSQGAKGDPPDGQLVLTAAGGWPSTTNGCADPTKVEYGTNDIDLYVADFDPDSDEYMQWTVPMPSDWDGGTVVAAFYWIANSASTNGVVWGLQGRSLADNEAVDAAWGTGQTVTDANNAQNYMNISSATAAITLGGTPAASELVQFRGYRAGSSGGGSDNLAVDARLVAVRVTFTRT